MIESDVNISKIIIVLSLYILPDLAQSEYIFQVSSAYQSNIVATDHKTNWFYTSDSDFWSSFSHLSWKVTDLQSKFFLNLLDQQQELTLDAETWSLDITSLSKETHSLFLSLLLFFVFSRSS